MYTGWGWLGLGLMRGVAVARLGESVGHNGTGMANSFVFPMNGAPNDPGGPARKTACRLWSVLSLGHPRHIIYSDGQPLYPILQAVTVSAISAGQAPDNSRRPRVLVRVNTRRDRGWKHRKHTLYTV